MAEETGDLKALVHSVPLEQLDAVILAVERRANAYDALAQDLRRCLPGPDDKAAWGRRRDLVSEKLAELLSLHGEVRLADHFASGTAEYLAALRVVRSDQRFERVLHPGRFGREVYARLRDRAARTTPRGQA